MSKPLRLSGRRRQATSPQATNDAPTMRKATSMGSNGTCRKSTGASAPNVAAAASTQRNTHRAAERRSLPNRWASSVSPRPRGKANPLVIEPPVVGRGR